jgi:hypothetical protein
MSVDPASSYYDAGGIEVFRIIEAKLGPEGYRSFLLGNILKYGCRCLHKGQAQSDARKMRVYAELLEAALAEGELP